ncbi:MAG: TIGR03086 family protein [Actinobacteria bacterium]|nr:MAG: TIGR03086 family protein [Actinomycetota bacterium]
MEILEQLEGAFGTTERIVAGIRPDQLSEPTPCKEWDVRTLLGHTTGVLTRFGWTARRERPPEDGVTDALAEDFAAAYRAAAASTLAAWAAPGALEGTCRLPIGVEIPAPAAAGINVVDTLVHGWDLARATGQARTIDPALATAALEFCRSAITDDIRERGAFGAIVPVPDDATPTDRLVGFLGRQP